MLEKADEYLAMGVRSFYVVDTKRKRVLVPSAGGLSVAEGPLSVGGTSIDISQVFANLWRG